MYFYIVNINENNYKLNPSLHIMCTILLRIDIECSHIFRNSSLSQHTVVHVVKQMGYYIYSNRRRSSKTILLYCHPHITHHAITRCCVQYITTQASVALTLCAATFGVR